MSNRIRPTLTTFLWLVLPAAALADDPQTVEIAGGSLAFEAPAAWQVVPPKSRILEKELSVVPPEGVEAKPARLTLMAAGGSVEANLARWVGQFQGAGAGDSTTEELTVDGMPTKLLDIRGVYLESAGGPFGPKTPRPDYRMLGAIVETGGSGNYFFKLVGPAATVSPAADAFKAMLQSLKKK